MVVITLYRALNDFLSHLKTKGKIIIKQYTVSALNKKKEIYEKYLMYN